MRTIDADALLNDFKKRHKRAIDWKERAIFEDDQELIIRADATIDFLIEVKLTIENAPTVEPAIQKESSWIWQTYTNGFGTFKALRCERCGSKRNQVTLRYCANCGAKMANAEEIGGEEDA